MTPSTSEDAIRNSEMSHSELEWDFDQRHQKMQKSGNLMSESVKRIIAMTLITLVILMIGAGGYKDVLSMMFVGAIAVLWSIPTTLLMIGFQALERVLGKRGPYIIAMVGLAPLMLVIGFGGRGDHVYMAVIVISGLVWSAAWMATFNHFLKRAR